MKDQFLQALMRSLVIVKLYRPKKYSWPMSEVFEVYRRVAASLENGLYSTDFLEIRLTCDELGIKSDRTTIDKIFAR